MAAGALIAIGLAASAVGTVMQASAASKAAKESKRANLMAENARQQQTQLEANRRRREAVRQALLTRSNAIATGTSQGAAQGSGVAGAAGQAVAQGMQTQQTTNAAVSIGNQIHDANRALAVSQAKMQRTQALGGAISALGGGLVDMAPTFGRIVGRA